MAAPGTPHTRPSVTPRRLWFGFVGTAAAWFVLGVVDLTIVWFECAYEAQYAPPPGVHPYARGISFAVGVALIIVAVMAGVTSYRNWRALSPERDLLKTTATDRREFMALLGVIVTVTLGFGMFWTSLVAVLIPFCERAK